jgi:L-threonylcarbamoyladenylate synthase
MASVVAWQAYSPPRQVLRQALQTLHGGGVAAFPTETGYCLAGTGLLPATAARIRSAAAVESLTPGVRGVADVREWVPGLGPLGQRLARRFWPGPLVLRVADGAGAGLAGRLPVEVRGRLGPAGRIDLRAPAHEAIQEVLRHLPGPLLFAPAPTAQAGTPGGHLDGLRGLDVDLVVEDGPRPTGEGPTVVEVDGEHWQVVQQGAISAEQLQRQLACLIVFVCTGNTCRSPLAEGLCKRLLADRLGCTVDELPQRGFLVLSAGLAAMMGGGAAPEAIEVGREYRADLTGHRSRPLTEELAAQADYLIAMTRGHLQALQDHFPRLGARPRLLNAAGEDLADPIGQPRAVYQECARQIRRDLEGFVAALVPDAAPREEVKP